MPRFVPTIFVLGLVCAACDRAPDGAGDPREAAKGAAASLADTRWRLTALGGEPVEAPGGKGTVPFIQFLPGGEMSGFGGCNRFTGEFEREGGHLSIGAIVSTKMACPDIGDLEQRFFSTLDRVGGYRVEDGRLVLLDERGRGIARLESAPGPTGKG